MSNTMTNKNPFEIRSEMLMMAKEMLDRQYDTQLAVAHQMMDMYRDNAEKAMEAYKEYVPKMYTPEEIKAQATKLYEFVADKK